LSAGVPRAKGGASASCVAAYRLTQGGAEPAGLLLPSGVKMLSFVRSLPAVDAFLTGGAHWARLWLRHSTLTRLP
jgi:hypothetical protein